MFYFISDNFILTFSLILSKFFNSNMHKNIPNKFYFINSFKKNNIDKLDNNTGVIYRNYNKKLNIKEIIKIKKILFKKKK